MKQKFGLFALIALLSCPAFGQINAQTNVQGVGLSTASLELNEYFKPKKKKKKKKKDDEKDATSFTNWKERLWYGAGGTLNFGSNGQSSAFQIGLQPMVGYKIFPFWSVGPRFGLDYFSYRKIQNGAGYIVNQSGWIPAAGAFTRLRFWNFFLHGEVSQQWFRGKETLANTTESYKFNEKLRSRLVGLGWNEGRAGQVGYEIALLFDVDVLADENSTLNPFQIRGALTYNF